MVARWVSQTSRVDASAASASSQPALSRSRRGLPAAPPPGAPAAAAGRRGLAQQGAALAQHLVEVGAHAGQPGRERHQRVVHEPAPPLGVPLDEGEVLRREQHRAQRPEHVAGARQR